MAESVSIACGEKPRYFQFGSPPTNLATANGSSLPLYKERVFCTFQAISSLAAGGAVTATVTLKASNSDKTGKGVPIGVFISNGSTTVTSGALFAGFIDQTTSQWIPPVQIGDTIVGQGIPAAATVTAIASASSITISAAATASISVIATFQDSNWGSTVLGTITAAGTNNGTDVLVGIATPCRFVQATVAALTAGGVCQVIMGT